MTINAVLLVVLSAWVLQRGLADRAPVAAGVVTSPTPTPSRIPIPTREDILATTGQRFGLSAPEVPWSSVEINRIAERAGVVPTMLQFFVHWSDPMRFDAIPASYAKGAIPVISWEPWAGRAAGEDQPEYALSRIIAGEFDDYLTAVATGIRDQQYPVVIRFAHEMNGHWYPWSEQRSGNRPGEFVQAWRHVHDVFDRVGATNVIWVWSPNILRPVPTVSLADLYPGDEYVDWVGMVGYAVGERTAAEVFEPTMQAIRAFTSRPFLITETGAAPGPAKAPWISDFFAWLPQQPDVVGVIWFEFSPADGGTEDWRLTETSDTVAAFRAGASRIAWAPPLPIPDERR
jgi:hypothetical protein